MSSISFWTPVKYGNRPTTLLQKATEFVDDYFYLGGRVAHVMSEGKAILGSGRAKWWRTVLKVISYGAVFINLFARARSPGLKQFRSIVYLQTLLNWFPVGMLAMKVILRWFSQIKIQRLQAFPELPSDLNLEIFKFLDPKSLAKASRVCKEWKILASTESLWRGHNLTQLFPKLSVIDKNVWETHVDLKAYGLSCEGEGDQRKVIQGLYKMFASLQIEKDAGITLLTMPQGLTFSKLEKFAESLSHKTSTCFTLPSFLNDFRDDPVKNTYQIAILKDSETQRKDAHMPEVLETSAFTILTHITATSPTPLCSKLIIPQFALCEKDQILLDFKPFSISVHSLPSSSPYISCNVGLVQKFAPASFVDSH